MNYVDSDMVKEYIENEIEYIDNYGLECDKQDIEYLNGLTDEDIEEITQKVNDDEELQDKINELIHYWLYHK